MKLLHPIPSILAAFIALTVLSSHAQQSFIHVASKSNNSCNGDCSTLDVPALNNNPDAIIWVTPIIEKGLDPNPHPIGLYYFQKQWRIMNLDQRPIAADTKFKVEYLSSADELHFQYAITTENLRRDGSAIIDHPALNNNPTVQFRSFVSWNPDLHRTATTNRDSITMQYNAATGRWQASNNNKKPLFARITYNIIISSKGTPGVPPMSNAIQINELLVTPTVASTNSPIQGMYMAVWADGIKLPGESSVTGQLDKIELIDFEMNTNSPSGARRRSYEPITIKKTTGLAATIPLFNAYVKGQEITATIDVISMETQTGKSGLNYSIKLSGARIVSFRQIKEDNSSDQIKRVASYTDEIKITFTKIEYIKDGVSVIDTW